MIVKAGRNEANQIFKEAVQDELHRRGAKMLTGKWNKITLGFWRRLDKYEDSGGRTRTKNWADATNMQKLTEDALQGILFENDRNNFEVTSRIVQQTPQTTPGILILCETFSEIPVWSIPSDFADYEDEIANEINRIALEAMPFPGSGSVIEPGNDWPPRP